MALILAAEDQVGNAYQAAYWRIDNVFVNMPNKNSCVSIRIVGYRDRQARHENKQPFAWKSSTVVGADYDQYFSPAVVSVAGRNHIERAYAYVKAQPDWESAIDV